ncbi:MAG: O-antigen ligase family protein [Chloroflexi bacterium]|nr:O-antigen ligase family protein [Chloroflexota bacterium]
MKTRLAIGAMAISEAALLVACITVPVLFNSYSDRVFELDKGAWLRTLVLLGLLAWGIVRAESELSAKFRLSTGSGAGRERAERKPRVAGSGKIFTWPLPEAPALLRQPLGLAVAAYFLIFGIATLFSVQQAVSWWGTYERGQGFLAYLGYGGVFLLGLAVLTQPGAMGRIWRALMLSGSLIALYAVMQRLGLDPGQWSSAEAAIRVIGTFGNPNFLGSYLVLIWPLSLLGMLGQALPGEERIPGLGMRLCYGGAAVLQGSALFLTLSRGPFLGFLTEIGVVLWLWAALRGRRDLLLGFAAALLVGGGFLLVIGMPGTSISFVRDLPYVGRLARALDPTSRSAEARLLTWEAVLGLVGKSPLIGYGPDTLILTFNRVFPEALIPIANAPNTTFDRAHNQVLDGLYAAGILGAVATLWLYGSVFAVGAGLLKRATESTRRRVEQRTDPSPKTKWLWAAMAGVPLVCALVVWSVAGWRVTVGVVVAIGLLAAVLGWFAWWGWQRGGKLRLAQRGKSAESALPWPVILLLAALAGNLVEMQFGFAVVTTSFIFWLYLAAFAVWAGLSGRQQGEGDSRVLSTSPVTEVVAGNRPGNLPSPGLTATATPGKSGRLALCLAPLLGSILMITLIMAFLTPQTGLKQVGFSILLLLVVAWTGSGVYFLGLVPPVQSETATALFSWVSLAILAPYLWLHLMFLSQGGMYVWSLYQVAGLMLVGAVAAALYAAKAEFQLSTVSSAGPAEGTKDSRTWKSGRRAWLYLAGGIGCVGLSLVLNQRPVLADIQFHQGMEFARIQNWTESMAAFADALRLAPYQTYYRIFQAGALVEAARPVYLQGQGVSPNGEAYLAQAEATLQEAVKENPLYLANISRLGLFYDNRAAWARDQGTRRRYLDLAVAAYEQAIDLAPHSVPLLIEAGAVYLHRGDTGKVQDLVQEAQDLLPDYPPAYALLGDMHLQRGEIDAAAAAYRQAVTLDPTEPLQTRVDAVENNPGNPQHHLQLGLLYDVLGKRAEALEQVRLGVQLMGDPAPAYARQLLSRLQ